MDRLKTFMSGASNSAKDLGKSVQNKGNDLAKSAQQSANDASKKAKETYEDADFDDYKDKAKSQTQGLQNKAKTLGANVENKTKDFANSYKEKADQHLNDFTDNCEQHMGRLNAYLGVGGPKLLNRRVGVLEDDIDSGDEWTKKNVPMEQIQYKIDNSTNLSDIRKNYKLLVQKASNQLEDDFEKEVSRVPTKKDVAVSTFKASLELLDDPDELPKASIPTKTDVKVNKRKAGNLVDDSDEQNEKDKKELEELKKKNKKLQEGNQSLSAKNHDLEDELAREIEKNKELRRKLTQQQSSPQTNPQTESPKKAAPSPSKRPLGSPKLEFYNKQSVRSPDYHKHAPDSGTKLAKSEQMSPGALIRKKIEEEEDLSRGYSSVPRLSQNTPAEYFSPVKHESPNRNYPHSPSLSAKTFRDHDLLPNATNGANFQLACLRNQEILYEDDTLVVETQTAYIEGTRNSEPLVRIAFSYTNKTPTELRDFTVTYKNIHNVVLSAESTDAAQILRPRETQVHRLEACLVGPLSVFGFFVIEYRTATEPHQIKLDSPIVLTKFAKFQPLSPGEFNREKKILQSQYPNNYEESNKIRLSQKNLRAIKDTLLAKMTLLETDDGNTRFSVYGGAVQLSDIQGQAIVRLIIENETQLLMVQLHYEEELEEYAKEFVRMLAFLCNDKVIV